ncbi:MAG: response regulator, partial [Verrucomicrobia bacterium]|nr:response regulator [Verrucomicrobiota bacterium]
MVESDSIRLRQVVTNLLTNAIKFTEKGEILLTVELVSSQPAPAPDYSQLRLRFSVRDTGIGIKPDRLARLFQPFTQADITIARQYGGTGLGLAISKRIVELMGGEMGAESVPGQGSTFHFTANVLAGRIAQPPPHTRRRDRVVDLRILIVDDNATMRRVLSEQSQQWGMVPVAVENPRQALEQLRAGEEFDLALVDSELQGIEGPAFAAEIHRVPSAAMIPVIFMMPLGGHADTLSTHVVFANSVAKPVRPAQLLAVIEKALFSQKTPAPAAPLKPGESLAERYPLQILLVDDNSINQKVAARLVQQLGYKPEMVANGKETLEAMDRRRYDLIFMDMMMPEMDGLEATRIIRQRQKAWPEYPNYQARIIVIAMTAHAMQSDREKCFAAGMDDYLAKPIRPADVRQVIERWGSLLCPAGGAGGAKPAAGLEPMMPPRGAAITSEPVVPQPAAPTAPVPPTVVSPAPARTPAPPATAAPSRETPVDLVRLMDLTQGDIPSVKELVIMFYDQTVRQLQQIEEAVKANDAPVVRHVAHSCKGATATLGMSPFAAIFLGLENAGKSGSLGDAPALCGQARAEFKRVQMFFAAQPDLAIAPPSE